MNTADAEAAWKLAEEFKQILDTIANNLDSIDSRLMDINQTLQNQKNTLDP